MNNLSMPDAVKSAISWDLMPSALAQWNPGIRAQEQSSDNTITIFDVIGEDYWTGQGVTAKRISAALRRIGDNPVEVYINSPGGDLFEGLAIYGLLKEHSAKVTVKVLGLAASAASVIAMAGDEIQIYRSAFFMVHNSWVLAAGDRNQLVEVAEWLAPFDSAISDIYASRTGIDIEKVQEQMDKETWIGGKEAVDSGYADDLLDNDIVEEANALSVVRVERQIEMALRKSGMSAKNAKKAISEIKSASRDAGGTDVRDDVGKGQRDAVNEVKAMFASLNKSLQVDWN